MRKLILLLIAALAFGCSDKDNSKTSNNDSLKTDSADTKAIKIAALNEPIQYIGFMNQFYFSKDNEVYIELYLTNNNITADEYSQLEKLADSLIYEDDENSRHRFPARFSSKHFDLRGLSKLKIYDNNNTFVCDADFVRVEYLSETISSSFIAVYKTSKKIQSDNYYCISNFKATFDPIDYSITKDTVFTQKILTKLNVPKAYNGLEDSGTHIQFKNGNTLSIINSESLAYIILNSGEEFKVLYKSSEPENILDVKV
ncbi:MAG TPA: hypothetical protein VJL37_05130, partial [Flavobacterium sp.]|nr:hypothetical protein [Flavobacterium sp.]